jgi:murein DD-endopeptidase MepM/ murein hydrolase activator NlpD
MLRRPAETAERTGRAAPLRASLLGASLIACAMLGVPVAAEATPRRLAQNRVAAAAAASDEVLEESCNQTIPAAVLEALADPATVGGSAAFVSTSPSRAELALTASRPTDWQPVKGRDCHRYRGKRVCEGPRKIAQGPRQAEALRERLGLGTHEAAARLLHDPAKEEWIAAVRGEEPESFLFPVENGKLWRGFGRVRKGKARKRPHEGIDIGATEGTPFRAAADGLVAYSDNGVSGYGNLIIILHKDGRTTFYAHNHANYVVAGEQVLRGQIIGEVGDTGLARGAHVHFEMHRAGRPINPVPHLEMDGGDTEGDDEAEDDDAHASL